MARQQALSIITLRNALQEDVDSTGCCIVLVENENENSNWKFLVYLGEQKLLLLFEKNNGLLPESIDYLSSEMTRCDRDNVLRRFEIPQTGIQLIELNEDIASDAQFYKYNLNLFKTAINNNMRSAELLDIIRSNLLQIQTLQKGDIIWFDRKLFHHAAVLIDDTHMICIHRNAEPDNSAFLLNFGSSVSPSLSHNQRPCVTEDHLIDIANCSKLEKRNDFDHQCMPRYNFFNNSK